VESGPASRRQARHRDVTQFSRDVVEVWVLQGVLGGDALLGIVLQHALGERGGGQDRTATRGCTDGEQVDPGRIEARNDMLEVTRRIDREVGLPGKEGC